MCVDIPRASMYIGSKLGRTRPQPDGLQMIWCVCSFLLLLKCCFPVEQIDCYDNTGHVCAYVVANGIVVRIARSCIGGRVVGVVPCHGIR